MKDQRLTFIKHHSHNKHGQKFGLYMCECGKEKKILINDVTGGRTRSCGCYVKKHGQRNKPIYQTWRSMKKRCYDENNISYKTYGAVGVTVCDRWLDSFENFYEDMGDRPEGMTLDRIDNNKGYCKENCRWATAKSQCRNRKNNRLVTIYGVTATLSEWIEVLEVPKSRVGSRLTKGHSEYYSLFGRSRKIKYID